MSSKTTNLNLTKPSEDEFYDINVQNENMDIIDREINGLKQPAYEVSTAMSDLNSGEMITVAFGKIAKAVSTLISHTTSKATNSVLGHVKLSDSTSSTSASTAGVAATPKAVKAAYDLANSNTKKIGTTDISGIGDGTVTGAIAENKDAIEDVTQSLIPNYETTKTVLSDNSKASYTKKYVVNKDSWFACDHQSYNGYSWGNVFVNDIRVAGFRAMPIDEAHYAYSSTTFFAPKGSTIIINGAGGMTVNVSEIG